MAKLRAQIRMVSNQIESPIDYVKSEIKSLLLAADSMNMDVQYFILDTNTQDLNAYASAISAYVSAATAFLGDKFLTQMSTAAQTQVSRQVSSHKTIGMLVLSVPCTQKNASILALFILDVDEGIKV